MQKLHPNSLWLFFGRHMIRGGSAAIVLIILIKNSIELVELKTATGITAHPFLIYLIGIALFLIIVYIWAMLSYRFYRYELREDGFRKEYGVIAKKYVTIPYERIQNVDIYRSIVARILGISELRIQTAGSSGGGYGYNYRKRMWVEAEGSLPGISHEVAEQLRDELVKRSKEG